MSRRGKNTGKQPLTLRALAIVLAMAMLFTSSGFQVLAEEVGTEIQTDNAQEAEAARIAAEEEAARIAAEEEAARLAAEQAAAESEAEAARLAAEQAAAESEAEAARLAAEQAAAESEAEAARLAAEEQAAEESEAAAAAEQAAAEQAAADAEAARLAAESEAAANHAAEEQKTTEEETTEAPVNGTEAEEPAAEEEPTSQETAPVAGSKLVLKTEPTSVQNPDEYPKLKVEYGLGAGCTLEAVETRLYAWNENVVFPQFDKEGKYVDPTSKRTFLLKIDSDGDKYIEYMLKPGESFIQEFQIADSTVTTGTEITFDVVICAMGEVPIDQDIQKTAAKVTYSLPPAETEEAVTEAVLETETEEAVETEEFAETEEFVETEEIGEIKTETEEAAETEAPAETEELVETEAPVVENVVTFTVAEGVTVTVDGVDATNTTAMAKNGTIIFTVAAEEGYEITEVLVDGTIPARTTGNPGEYIIENIQTDATVVTVEANAVETETEPETAVETETETETTVETETETETESESESESETETESETEVKYGTSFTYEDSEVVITAVASEEAKIPADAVLKADLVTGFAHDEAVALAEDQLGTEEDYEAEYVFYDIYFLANGERVEPAEGLVSVTMEFKTPLFEEVAEEKEVVDYSVIHITDEAEVQDVTDHVQATDEGTVESVGFTTDSFSLYGMQRMSAPRAGVQYRVTGEYDTTTGRIVWKVYFNESGSTLQEGTINLTCTFPDSLKVYDQIQLADYTMKHLAYLQNGSSRSEVWFNAGQDIPGQLTWSTYLQETTDEVYLEFQTDVIDKINWSDDMEVVNNAAITIDVNGGGTISGVGQSDPVSVPSIFDGGSLDPYITSFEIYTKDETGAYKDKYDSGDRLEKGGSFEMQVFFSEVLNGLQLPVNVNAEEGRLISPITKLTLQIPKEKITGFLGETGDIVLEDSSQAAKYGTGGTYSISEDGLVTLYLKAAYIKEYPNCAGSFKFRGNFSRDVNSTPDTEEIKITDNVTKVVEFEDSTLTVQKEILDDYQKSAGIFKYKISILVYGTVTDVTVKDTLQENLELLIDNTHPIEIEPSGALQLSARSQNGFTLQADSLSKEDGKNYKEYTITYYAKIKQEVLNSANGIVEKIGNTVTVDFNGDETVRDTVNPSYSQYWVDKSEGELQEDGRVKWTIRVNEGGKQNAQNVTISDTLGSDYIRYDISKPIEVVKKGTEGIILSTSFLRWEEVLQPEGTSWSYTITEDGNYEYEFSYYTFVDGAGAGTNTQENTATIEKEGQVVNDTGSYTGTGTGTGVGHVVKDYKGTTEVDGTKYAQWESTITVPVGGLQNVVFYDELNGDHILPDNFDVTIGDTYSGSHTIVVGENKKSFTLYFADTADQTKSALSDKGTEYTVKISYQTQVDAGEDKSVGNTARLTANGKTEMSVVPKKTLKSYLFKKSGSVDDTGKKINWTISLDKTLTADDMPLVVRETISSNHQYLDGTAKIVTIDASGVQKTVSGAFVQYTGTLNNPVFTILISMKPDVQYYLAYQTEITNANNKNYTNEASIISGTDEIGKVYDEVNTATKPIVKTQTIAPTKDNKYVAQFQIEISGKGLSDITEDFEGDYTVVDRPVLVPADASLTIQENTIEVVLVQDDDTETAVTNYSYTYSNNRLKLTIPEAGKNTYRIRYSALLQKPEGTSGVVPVAYSNTAVFTAEGYEYSSIVRDSADIDSSGSASIGGSKIYISVYKEAENNSNTKLSGVEFELYLLENGAEILLATGTTGTNGLTFGKPEESATGTPAYVLYKDGQEYFFESGKTYRLYETKGAAGYEEITDPVLVKEFTVGTGQGEINASLNGQLHIPNKAVVQKTVTKVWDDEDDYDEIRPEQVKMQLKRTWNGNTGEAEVVDTVILSTVNAADANTWSYTWTELDKYHKSGSEENGYNYSEYIYSVEEVGISYDPVGQADANFESVPTVKTAGSEYYQTTSQDGWTITNHHDKKVKNYTFEKVWDDADNQDGVRPASVTVVLQRTYTGLSEPQTVETRVLTAANTNGTWSYTWSNIPDKIYIDGVAYDCTYSIEETKVTYNGGGSYDVVKREDEIIDGNPYYVTSSQDGTTWTFTNHYTPKVTDVEGTKTWDTKGDQDAVIPQQIKVTLTAKVDGTALTGNDLIKVLNGEPAEKTISPNAGVWTYKWEGLDRYFNGKEIAYSVTESAVNNGDLDGWSNTKNTPVYSNGKWTCNMTNTFMNDTSVSATKKWVDQNNRDNKRPVDITFTLYRQKLAADGTLNGATVDGSNDVRYGGKVYTKIESATISGDSTASEWATKTWNQLPKKWGQISGTAPSIANSEIDYLVLETDVTYPNGVANETYTLGTPVKTQNGFEITNRYQPESTSVKVQKVWEDSANRDKIRPSTITFTLYRYVGTVTDESVPESVEQDLSGNSVQPIVLSATNGNYSTLEGTWNNLPVYENGKKITYTVQEEMTAAEDSEEDETQYSTNITMAEAVNGSTITVTATNTYRAAETSVSVQKIWNDDDNRDGIRPLKIVVQLYADGEPVSNEDGGVVELPNSNGTGGFEDETWSYTWSGLKKNENGRAIVYSVKEFFYTENGQTTTEDLDGYQSTVQKTSAAGAETFSYTITNTHEIAKTNRYVVKLWDDENDQDGVRPETIRVTLQEKDQNAETETWKTSSVNSATVDLSETNGWKASWVNLPKNEKYTKDGVEYSREIIYRVVETPFTVNGGEGTQYTAVYALAASAEDITLDTELSYAASVPVTNLNQPVVVIKNSREVDRVNKEVSKVWADNENMAGLRPNEVYAWLYKKTGNSQPEKVGTTPVLLNKAHNWSYTWSNLPEKENGQIITYSVKEFVSGENGGYIEVTEKGDIPYYDAPAYYESEGIMIIQNHYETEKVSRTAYKYWQGDSEEVRPEKIVLQLMMSLYDEQAGKYADPIIACRTITEDGKYTPDEAIGAVTVTGSLDVWTYTWNDLDKTYGGKPIKYSVKEVGYYVKGDDQKKPGVPKGYQVVMGDPGNTEEEPAEIVIKNVYPKLEISKKSLTDGAELKGAGLAIYAYDETTGKKVGNALISFTSGDAPYVLEGAELAKLQVGETYVLCEESVPAGYLKADDQTFTLNADGTTTKVVMYDAQTEIQVSKRKVTGDDELPGATIQIIPLDDKGQELAPVATWISGTTPHTVRGLTVGTTYILRETIAPDGYTVASDIRFVISVDESGSEEIVTVGGKAVEDNLLIIRDSLRQVSFAKVDQDGKPVEGAHLEVHYAAGENDEEIGALAVTVKGEALQWVSGQKEKTFSGLRN
ncbi:MAG: Cna B-type domain-containing protein, partial [Candidatus Limivivens sp.]|nr:Cna B-type domain-containing protein [Candidatus Limivivens sp.]